MNIKIGIYRLIVRAKWYLKRQVSRKMILDEQHEEAKELFMKILKDKNSELCYSVNTGKRTVATYDTVILFEYKKSIIIHKDSILYNIPCTSEVVHHYLVDEFEKEQNKRVRGVEHKLNKILIRCFRC